MRDLQHWKDKVELSLDGRQLFFLFFGGAIGACLLFALGVMTGRRIEARAIAMEAPSTDDPLAQLDQLGDLEDEELTYHRALTKDGHATKPAHMAAPQAAKPAMSTPTLAAPKPTLKPATPPKKAALDEPASAPTAMTEAHFTLQLSAFAAKRDADDFKRRVEAAGYHPYVVASAVAGKGILYRVRVGDYSDRESATAEKTSVDKRLGVAAYLAKI